MSCRHARALRNLVLLLCLGLSACADTMDSPPSARVLQRDYDKTLTKDERQAVISDLQSATAKKEGKSDAEGAATTEAESGENTN
jgi:hypothetical protein